MSSTPRNAALDVVLSSARDATSEAHVYGSEATQLTPVAAKNGVVSRPWSELTQKNASQINKLPPGMRPLNFK